MFSAQGNETATTTSTDDQLDNAQENIFSLIDTVLPFEACLYHQILPLKLEKDRLILGMVYLEDNDALDYVRLLLSYLQLLLVTELTTTETHRTILTAYLNYKNTTPKNTQLEHKLNITTTFTESETQPTPAIDQQPVPSNPISITSDLSPDHHLLKPMKMVSIDNSNNTKLAIKIPHIFSSLEVLGTLPPKKILAELLGRILSAKIGRLYLERKPYLGRITWSENGVLQARLEELPLSVFQGILNELKRLASLPMNTVAEPQQVEREYIYKEKHLLLRWRIMPGKYGEEATIQILQESALKFYHQKQLSHLSHKTLSTIKRLNHLLHNIQEILTSDSETNPQQLANLSILSQTAENLDQQIKSFLHNTY